MALSDFTKGTTKGFRVTFLLDGVAQDITSDTVIFTMKKDVDQPDEKAAIVSTADVGTEGADGVAIFTLSKTETNIDPDTYHYDIQWQLAGGAEYAPPSIRGTVRVLNRVSDV